ncbi:MAG: DUF6493 family protein [Bifidobacteriaceae bacterium]|jgi:hypothetical protein|nr:DUF6493 family protein [Bifidobacteriaceae bacterium]
MAGGKGVNVARLAADIGYGRLEPEEAAPAALDALLAQADAWTWADPDDRLRVRPTLFGPWFLVCRSLERLGRFAPPHDDDYVLALVSLGGWSVKDSVRQAWIEALLRQDADLREGVFWRIFEVEGGGEMSLTIAEVTWTQALLALAADGTLPRGRVMRSCLEALGRDFSSYRAGAFRRIYDALGPSAGELARDQDLVLPLLASPISQTASWAVKAAAALDKAHALDDAVFARLAPACVSGGKAAALKTLGILARVRVRDPQLADAVASAAADALGHGDVAVQERAATALVSWGRLDLVAERADWLAPSVRAALPLDEPAGADAPAATEPPARPAREGAPAKAGPAGSPAPAEADAAGAPRFPCRQLGPADDAEVARLLPQMLEGEADPLDAERVLARVALAGLDQALANSLAKRARAVPGLLRGMPEDPVRAVAAALVAAWLDGAKGWLDRDPPAPPLAAHQREALGWELHARLMEGEHWADYRRGRGLAELPWPLGAVVSQVLGGAAAQEEGLVLWCTASDSRGGIDPAVLVDRAQRNPEPTGADLAAALLRLNPGGREAALERAAGVPGLAGAALRYALGGGGVELAEHLAGAEISKAAAAALHALTGADLGRARRALAQADGHTGRAAAILLPDPGPDRAPANPIEGFASPTGKTLVSWVWAAAARARDPFGDDQAMIAAGLDGPGLGRVQRVGLNLYRQTWEVEGRVYHWTYYEIAAENAADAFPALAVEPLAHGGPIRRSRQLTCPAWTALVWPHNPEPFAALVLESVNFDLDVGEVDHNMLPGLRGLRRAPGRLGQIGALCLLAGLAVSTAAVRQEAIEWFAEAVPERVSMELLAEQFAFAAPGVHLHRWAASLADAASISPATAAQTRELLTKALPGVARTQRRLADLLRLLLEESIRAAVPVADQTLREWLSAFAGSGGAAKAARQLLELRP